MTQDTGFYESWKDVGFLGAKRVSWEGLCYQHKLPFFLVSIEVLGRLFQMKSRKNILKLFPQPLGHGGFVWDRLGSFFILFSPQVMQKLSL